MIGGPPLSWKRTPGPLHGRTRRNGVVPALQIGIILQADVVDAMQMHVGIHRHVGDRIVPTEIFVRRKMPVEDASISRKLAS